MGGSGGGHKPSSCDGVADAYHELATATGALPLGTGKPLAPFGLGYGPDETL
jgi:hypothetical protein